MISQVTSGKGGVKELDQLSQASSPGPFAVVIAPFVLPPPSCSRFMAVKVWGV